MSSTPAYSGCLDFSDLPDVVSVGRTVAFLGPFFISSQSCILSSDRLYLGKSIIYSLYFVTGLELSFV